MTPTNHSHIHSPLRLLRIFACLSLASRILLTAATTPVPWQNYFGGVQGATNGDPATLPAWNKTFRESNDSMAFPFAAGSTSPYGDYFNDLAPVSSTTNSLANNLAATNPQSNRNPLVLNTIYFNAIIVGHDWIYGQNIGHHNRDECDIAQFNNRSKNQTGTGVFDPLNDSAASATSDPWRWQVYQKVKQFQKQRKALRVAGNTNLGKIYWQIGNEITDDRGPFGQVFWLNGKRCLTSDTGTVAPIAISNSGATFPYPAPHNDNTGTPMTNLLYGDTDPNPLRNASGHNAIYTTIPWDRCHPTLPTVTNGNVNEWTYVNTSTADTAMIPYLVEYYMVPTIEAIKVANSELSAADAAAGDGVKIILGSISGSSGTYNRRFYLQSLLDYVTKDVKATTTGWQGSFASATHKDLVVKKRIRDLVDIVSYHYLLTSETHGLATDKGTGAYTWLDAYNADIYDGIYRATDSGTVTGVWATEELGKQRSTAGEGASHTLRLVGRYLDTWLSKSPIPSPENVRVVLYGWKDAGRIDNVGNAKLYSGTDCVVQDGFKVSGWSDGTNFVDCQISKLGTEPPIGDCNTLPTPATISPRFNPSPTPNTATDALNQMISFTGSSAALVRLNAGSPKSGGLFITPTVPASTDVKNIESYSFATTDDNKRVAIITPQYAYTIAWTSGGLIGSSMSTATNQVDTKITGVTIPKSGWSTVKIKAYRYTSTGLTFYSYGYGSDSLVVTATGSNWNVSFPSGAIIDLNENESPKMASDAVRRSVVIGNDAQSILFCIEK